MGRDSWSGRDHLDQAAYELSLNQLDPVERARLWQDSFRILDAVISGG
jgi:hypothetical protein